uniref:Mediator of DNA damage checkpoint protein 1 n=1 Tax=Plectus sambesii TaxID=2011161 RepID=A0A914VHL2_9BILA
MPSDFDELPETQPQFEFDDDEDDVENAPKRDLLQKPVAFLIFDENGSNERRRPVYGDGETIIGRDPLQCQIAIERSANISTVSRVHAKIFYEKGTHFIETLSANSTTKINKASLIHGRIYAIADGTLLTFGAVQARYVMQPENSDQQEVFEDVPPNVSDLFLNSTIDPDSCTDEQQSDNRFNQTSPINCDESRNSKIDELVTSPTTALTTSVVKETPQSADKDDEGLLLRLVESSPDGSPEKANTSDIRAKLNFSVNAENESLRENPLSETQDMFQSCTSSTIDEHNATPPSCKRRSSRLSQSSQSSPEMAVPRLRRLNNITPLRTAASPLAKAVRSEPAAPAMDIDDDDVPLKKGKAQVADAEVRVVEESAAQPTATVAADGDDCEVATDDHEVATDAQKALPKCQWTPSVELAALIKGHEELNTVPDILKTNTPRKKPDQEYDFSESSQEKKSGKAEEKSASVVTPLVTRASHAKADKDRIGVVVAEEGANANATPPNSALRKYRFEYFDPKSSGSKRRSGRSARMPPVVAKKTPKDDSTTPAKARASTGRKRRVMKRESMDEDEDDEFEEYKVKEDEIATETTTPLRRSTRKVKRIQYTSPPRSSSDSEPDSDDRPLIALVPKRTSTSSFDSSAAKRVKIAADVPKPKTKKASSQPPKDLPSPDSSSDDDAPLIVFRRSTSRTSDSSAKKQKKEPKQEKEQKQKKEKEPKQKRENEQTPTASNRSTSKEPLSPPVDRKTTPIRRGSKMRVVLKTVKEDAPSSPLHTPVDRRRIRKPETKFEAIADELVALDQDEDVALATFARAAAIDNSDDSDKPTPSKPTPGTPKLRLNQSPATPVSASRTSDSRRTSGTRASTRIKLGADDVGILLSSACMQDEELLKIAEELGEAKSICEATHFVANQPRRTSKLVASVARGIPIVTSEWLQACKRKGKLVDTKEYTLAGDIAGCDLLNAIEKSRNGWLSLDGWCIARTERAEPSAEEMSEVVKAAGGTLVESMTKECSLLIGHIDDRDDPLVKSAIKRRIPIVQGRMLYQAILEHTTDFKHPRFALKFL